MKTSILSVLVGCTMSFAAPIAGFAADTSVFLGCCDASAAVALTDELFVVANDEDNILRIYSRQRLGRPATTVDLTGFLNRGRKSAEVDIEAAAQVGDRIYWISSHGRNAKGKAQESRHRFFATTVSVTNDNVSLKPVGNFYSRLLEDLGRDPRMASFGLARAAQQAPKTEGALNIEGLAATPQGHLLIAFRNPVPQGKALIVPLLNPDDLIHNKPARFGEPILLDLDGLGIRGIEYWPARNGYVVIGGATDGTPDSHLYEWSGGNTSPRLLQTPSLASVNPEGIALYSNAASEQFLVLSDDGTLKIRGQDCKKLKDPYARRFRALTLSLDEYVAHDFQRTTDARVQK